MSTLGAMMLWKYDDRLRNSRQEITTKMVLERFEGFEAGFRSWEVQRSHGL